MRRGGFALGCFPPGSDFLPWMGRDLARRSHTLRKFPKNLAGPWRCVHAGGWILNAFTVRPRPRVSRPILGWPGDGFHTKPPTRRNRPRNRLDAAASATGRAATARHAPWSRGAAARPWHRTRPSAGYRAPGPPPQARRAVARVWCLHCPAFARPATKRAPTDADAFSAGSSAESVKGG